MNIDACRSYLEAVSTKENKPLITDAFRMMKLDPHAYFEASFLGAVEAGAELGSFQAGVIHGICIALLSSNREFAKEFEAYRLAQLNEC